MTLPLNRYPMASLVFQTETDKIYNLEKMGIYRKYKNKEGKTGWKLVGEIKQRFGSKKAFTSESRTSHVAQGMFQIIPDSVKKCVIAIHNLKGNDMRKQLVRWIKNGDIPSVTANRLLYKNAANSPKSAMLLAQIVMKNNIRTIRANRALRMQFDKLSQGAREFYAAAAYHQGASVAKRLLRQKAHLYLSKKGNPYKRGTANAYAYSYGKYVMERIQYFKGKVKGN